MKSNCPSDCGDLMRGPGMRLKLDVRRLWRCPRCGAERRLPADVTSVRCGCVNDAPFMQIVEPLRKVRPVPKPLNPYLTLDPDTPAEGDQDALTATQVVDRAASDTVVATGPSAPPQQRDRQGKSRRDRDRRPANASSPPGAATAPATPESPAPAATALIPNSPPGDPAPGDQIPACQSSASPTSDL